MCAWCASILPVWAVCVWAGSSFFLKGRFPMPYKDKSGWVAQVKVNGLKRKHRCKTRKEALQWEAEARKVRLTTCTASLLEWCNAYLDFSREKYVQKTYFEKRGAFSRLFASGFDARSGPDALTSFALLRHFQQQAKVRSGNAANKDRKNLAAGYSWAVKFLSYPPSNPFLQIPRQGEIRFPRRVPTLADFWQVFEAASPGQDRRMLLIYLYSGARRSELFRLRWGDVDFEQGRIRLFTMKTKDGSFRSDWVFLPDEAIQALREQRAECECGASLVFCDPATGGAFRARVQWLRRLCVRAGVLRFGHHGIRHLCASILAARGVPLVDIQRHLRHENLTTTQRYIHQLQSSRAVLDALADLRK